MTLRHPTARIIALAAALLAATASTTRADTGAWKNPASGLWSDPNNWIQGTVAGGTDATAFFSATLVADTTVTLDLPLSIGDISFNDNSNSKNWHLTSSNPGLVLNLSTAANRATISVNNRTAFIDLSLVGNSSLIKEAFGTLVITVPADYTASTQILAGTLQSGVANAIPALQPLFLDGGAFDLNGHAQQVTSVTGDGLVTNSSATPASFLSSSAANVSSETVFTGNLSFSFSGGGNLTLLSPSTYTGSTSITSGSIISAIDNALPATTTLIVVNPATFDLNGHNQQLHAITGIGNVTNSSATPSLLTLSSNADTTTQTHLTGNLSVTFTGGGNFTLQSPATYTGLTSIDAGTLVLSANASLHKIAGTGNLTLGAAISLTSDALQLSTLHVAAGSTHTIRPDGTNANASLLNTLTLDGATNAWTAALDLTNNKLLLAPATNRTAALADARNQALFGRTHANGLQASGLPANQTLAVIDNALAGKAAFAGMPTNANSILIAPELLGDANIDGKVDLSDLNTILNNFGATLPDWSSGNFDGAPTIDLTDLANVLNNFGQSLPNPTASIARTPEPTSLALLAPFVWSSVFRRRRTPMWSDA